MKIHTINIHEAEKYLDRLGMKIGDYGQIDLIDEKIKKNQKYYTFQAPREIYQLFGFCKWVIDWLPDGDWTMFNVDNIGEFCRYDQASLFYSLVGRNCDTEKEKGTFIVDTSDDAISSKFTLCNLAFIVLMFESHAQIVSSNFHDGRWIILHDGFVYFYSATDITPIKNTIEGFLQNGNAPSWTNKKLADYQSAILGINE